MCIKCEVRVSTAVKCVLIADTTGGYFVDFNHCGLFSERNPRDKRGTTVYHIFSSLGRRNRRGTGGTCSPPTSQKCLCELLRCRLPCLFLSALWHCFVPTFWMVPTHPPLINVYQKYSMLDVAFNRATVSVRGIRYPITFRVHCW